MAQEVEQDWRYYMITSSGGGRSHFSSRPLFLFQLDKKTIIHVFMTRNTSLWPFFFQTNLIGQRWNIHDKDCAKVTVTHRDTCHYDYQLVRPKDSPIIASSGLRQRTKPLGAQ